MDTTQIVDDIIQYVRLNLTSVRNKLKLPNGYRQITDKFKAECPHGELTELILPPIAQRAQGVIQETALIRELTIVVKSPMAKAIELKQSRLPEQPQEGYGSKRTVKTTSLDMEIPLGLSSFVSQETNDFAAERYTRYRRMFDPGKSIALTHRDLNATDLNLKKNPLVRQTQPVTPTPAPVPTPEPAVFNPKPMFVPKGDHTPALFSDSELRYSSKSAAKTTPIRTQKGTVIKRDSKVGVGKRTRDGSVYLHRDYMDRLPDQEGLEQAIDQLSDGYEWNVVRSDTDGTYAFYNCLDFDTADEPEGGQYVAVSPEGKLRPGKTYQIWHHKWCWVLDDYDGFDVEASKQRSRDWLALPDIDFNRIGKREFWEANVVPLIKTATRKVSYVKHMPGHENSKGEAAPWVIRQHNTDKILSSHKTEAEAKAHLQQMHIHKGSALLKKALGITDGFSTTTTGVDPGKLPAYQMPSYVQTKMIGPSPEHPNGHGDGDLPKSLWEDSLKGTIHFVKSEKESAAREGVFIALSVATIPKPWTGPALYDGDRGNPKRQLRAPGSKIFIRTVLHIIKGSTGPVSDVITALPIHQSRWNSDRSRGFGKEEFRAMLKDPGTGLTKAQITPLIENLIG